MTRPDRAGAGTESTSTGSTKPSTGEVQWLSPAERSAWLATASIMFTLPAALDARLQEQAGLSFFDYMVLSVLSEREDRTMQMSDIAAGVSSSLSRLSHVVTRLEKQSLVRRARVAGAGRRTVVTLTEQGWDRVVAAAPDHVRTVREYVIDVLRPEDLDVLTRLGGEVSRRVNPERPFLHGTS